MGVASTNAHGQKTTSTVTARTNWPEAPQARSAQTSATPTSAAAHLSARPTTGAFEASASSARRTMRASELSTHGLRALMVKVPSWLTTPLATSSPGALSTGMLSPVMTDWSTAVVPSVTTPSTGTVSPASTRTSSPAWTCPASTSTKPPPRRTRARCGVKRTRASMPRRARSAVWSSSIEPTCMMSATSPAANHSCA